jgi:hypothetical protein
MVADGGLERMRRDRKTGCPPIIRGVYASRLPSCAAASQLLSDYRGAPTIITARLGRRQPRRQPRSAPLP